MDLSAFITVAFYAILLELFSFNSARSTMASAARDFFLTFTGGSAHKRVVETTTTSTLSPTGELDDQYWKELEAEMYLVEFLNLTKSILAPKQADQPAPVLHVLPARCVEFADSLSRCQLALSELIEASNSVRLYEVHMSALKGEKLRDVSSKLLGELQAKFYRDSLFDRQRQALEAHEALGTMSSLYWDCLVALAGLDDDRRLHDQLLEVNDHMRILSELVDRVSLGQQLTSFIPFLSAPITDSLPSASNE